MSRETVKDDNTARDEKEIQNTKGKSATKLVLRNVAFEATKRDVQLLFNPFGVLKSVRVPKKFAGSHRGFAFIEYDAKGSDGRDGSVKERALVREKVRD